MDDANSNKIENVPVEEIVDLKFKIAELKAKLDSMEEECKETLNS